MKILILAAMDKEVSLLENLLETSFVEMVGTSKIISGNIGGHSISIAKCGIGKVNSAITSYRLISELKPDLLLNSGVAGGAGIKIGTILIADRVAYSDVWCGPGTDYGQADGIPLFMLPSPSAKDIANYLGKEVTTGLICSSDKFISTAEEINYIRGKFPDVKAVDMESAAIAQTCFLTDTPFMVIRVVSDTPGEGENIAQYKNFWKDAPMKTFNTLKEIIEKL